MISTTNLGTAKNQSWHTSINGHVYLFEILTIRGCIYASIEIDGVQVVNNVRCVKDGWLLPFKYMSPDGGNFRFETSDNSYPETTNFESKCRIMHYEKSDIEALGLEV